MEQQHTFYNSKERIRLDEPRRYKVIIHNDDFTTMEFVVRVLKEVFFKNEEEAEALMMKVHRSGSAAAGVYSYDIALSKAEKATSMARAEDFPLRFSVEPEEE